MIGDFELLHLSLVDGVDDEVVALLTYRLMPSITFTILSLLKLLQTNQGFYHFASEIFVKFIKVAPTSFSFNGFYSCLVEVAMNFRYL